MDRGAAGRLRRPRGAGAAIVGRGTAGADDRRRIRNAVRTVVARYGRNRRGTGAAHGHGQVPPCGGGLEYASRRARRRAPARHVDEVRGLAIISVVPHREWRGGIVSDDTPRLTPTQRLHEVTMQALTPAPRSGADSIEVGQEARTGKWYVKSINIYRQEDERMDAWSARVGALAALTTSELPITNGDAECAPNS